MPTRRSPKKGSLQYWPRKRASKLLPRVNWNAINSGKNLKGFIGYKAGMISACVKDNTPNSITKGKKIIIPCTLIECPPLKIFSLRLYKKGIVAKEIHAPNLDKELKRIIKIPKKRGLKIEEIKPEEYDNMRVICYSQPKKTKIKKTPDLSEIGLNGSAKEKLNFVKENFGKDIPITTVFEKGQIVDIRSLTKGKGLSGPVRRFGIGLKQHKSEKGRRRPGSLGPWHPARTTRFAPQAGQLGMFSRATYNNKIIEIKKSGEGLKNIKNFGEINSDYILLKGSTQGPAKRQMLITATLRPTKKQLKKDFEFIELR